MHLTRSSTLLLEVCVAPSSALEESWYPNLLTHHSMTNHYITNGERNPFPRVGVDFVTAPFIDSYEKTLGRNENATPGSPFMHSQMFGSGYPSNPRFRPWFPLSRTRIGGREEGPAYPKKKRPWEVLMKGNDFDTTSVSHLMSTRFATIPSHSKPRQIRYPIRFITNTWHASISSLMHALLLNNTSTSS